MRAEIESNQYSSGRGPAEVDGRMGGLGEDLIRTEVGFATTLRAAGRTTRAERMHDLANMVSFNLMEPWRR